MKRLLPAIICALALHAIILSSDFSWLKLGLRPAPASRSLTITLSADKLQKRDTRPAAANSEPEKSLQPDLEQKPEEKPAAIPAAARLESSALMQKQAPARTSQKPRRKKNLKALTRSIKPVKTTETARAESIDKDDVSPVVQAKIFSPVSSADQFRRDLLPSETAGIKKTHRSADEYTQSMNSAAALTSTKNNRSASATALIMAKPLYRQNPAPAYPRRARRLGYEGIVMLKVLVDENGRVNDLVVLETSGYPILDRTALVSVKKWLFEPGTEGGIKKKMWVRVPIRFRLE
ncbi:MAG: TonB family protein [Deltaproteobacteria bacterium]|nr:TonB family protein [Deltaproteobacteria bacterium]MBW2470112.1 TonB family protein [Deltaproteobacteria bacterium]